MQDPGHRRIVGHPLGQDGFAAGEGLPLARTDPAQRKAQLITEQDPERLAQRGALRARVACAEVIADALAQVLRGLRLAVRPRRAGADSDVEQCQSVPLFAAGDIDLARDVAEPPAVGARFAGHRRRLGEDLITRISLSCRKTCDGVGAPLRRYRLGHAPQRNRGRLQPPRRGHAALRSAGHCCAGRCRQCRHRSPTERTDRSESC